MNGEAKVEAYELQYRGIMRGDAREWKVANFWIEENYYRIPHLLTGVKYKFRVCAINKYGKGIFSEESEAFKLLDGTRLPSFRTGLPSFVCN